MMDSSGNLKSSSNQKTRSKKQKQTTTTKKSHSKTHNSSNEQIDNNSHSLSQLLTQLNLNRSHLNGNVRNDKSFRNFFEKHKRSEDKYSSRNGCQPGRFHDSNYDEYDFKGSRRKNLGSQCSSLRSSVSSIFSLEDTAQKSGIEVGHGKKYCPPTERNKKFNNNFKGDRRRDLGSQCSSLRSSVSSIFSLEDTAQKSGIEVGYGKKYCPPTERNKKFNNQFKGDRRIDLGSQYSSLRSSVSSIFSLEDTQQKFRTEVDHENKNCRPTGRHNKFKNHSSSHLSNHFIKSLIPKNDDLLTIIIMKNKDGFKNLFCSHKNVNDMIVVFELLNRICKMNDLSTKKYFLSFALNQQFIENMDIYISCILLGSSKDMQKNLEDLIKFYSELINIIPSENLDNYRELLISSLDKMEKMSHIPELMINNIKALIENISEKLENMNSEYDVSNLKILPSPEDINVVPNLQANIIKGPYENPSHYLNVQFKLLKEDFLCNLRSGLQEYETNLKEKKSTRIKDIFVYDAIYCGIMNRGQKTNLAISLEIDNKKMKRVEWKTSKRLIHGSLLLVSNDNFKTYYLTLLDDRGIPKSDDKSFVISALVLDKLINFKKYTKCTIIEPRVFFTPYFQVLKSIKKIDPNIFPMEKYIIQASTEIDPPVYINKNTNYMIAGNEVNVNKITSYEYPEIFALNEFQISALQAALTKEFVIIQGPPGTGKSYLGLKIINILLSNKSIWKRDESPILVICYRNNAVDQILESLIKGGRKIVRLGSQSNSELVKDHCLRNAVRPINSKIVLREQIKTIKEQIEMLKSQIAEMQTVVDCVNDKKVVLSLASLKEVLTSTQKEHLSKSNVYEEWLFGGYDEGDSNEMLLDDLFGNLDHNASLNVPKSSFLLLSINGLMNELLDLRSKVDYIYFNYNDLQLQGQDVLLNIVEILQAHEIRQLYLQKVINRINLDIDNFIDITRLNPDNLFDLSIPERWKLYNHWADIFCKQGLEKIEEYLCHINEKQNTLDELNDMSDGYKLQELCPDVVGATTTGAARTRALLTVIQPKIVIFEEAAEVLECHTITALTQFCEHIIMIGDHQQLRPNPASHISAFKYKLDISLFERMIKNGIEYFTLNEQHRMRPLISSLVIPSFYPNLQNHSSVENYPDVRGLKDNMYFVDHVIPEDELFDSESHRNKHEANFTLALADYLLKQEYEKKDITVLTFYGAQLFYLQALRSSYPSLKGVSLEVVDNFQGQENKIIILSLVRSNPNSIGFLSKMNRICVALTRAREGFYLIGNMTTLKGNSSVWQGINETLTKNNVIGSELPLKCNTHGTITNVRTADDFSPLVYGGCTLICGMKLECGHICEFQCHGSDEPHFGTYRCQKPCNRMAGCKVHECKVICGDPCPKCDEIVKTTLPCDHPGSKECEGGFLPCSSKCSDLLNCGHPCSKECHFPMEHLPEEFCPMPCDKPNINCPFGHKCQKACGEECGECVVKTITKLPCGHTVHGKCNKIKNKKCKVLVEKDLECSHTVKVECYKSDSEVECTKSNLKRLPCGHVIEVPCSNPTTTELICKENVEKCLPCGHVTTVPCHLSSEENLFCEELVEKKLTCGHGIQLEKCSTPPEAILCKKEVIKIVEECGHEVRIMCYMKSSNVQCKEPCGLINPCGHRCSGLCGQPCPDCQEMVEIDQVCGHKGLSTCAEIADIETSETIIESIGCLSCETLCKSTLKCGHQCEGTCGKCMQGRIHEACVATCGELLLCGHECSNNCSSGIHLCDGKCSNICKHQKCKNKCSRACSKCKQPCGWVCEHFRCSKLCWEECNRPVCEAPCKNLLPCGHGCNGFCGEPCPSVCITCCPDISSQSKYILLEDCGHVISKNEFSASMLTTIGLFLCPKCRKPQTSSHYIRYYTKKWFILLPIIRRKLLNKYNNVRGLICDTKSSLGRLYKLLKINFNGLKELQVLLKSIIESVKTIVLKQNESDCIETLRSLLFVSYYISEAFYLLQETNQTNDLYHLSRLNYLASYLKKWETGISRDQMHQFRDEIIRLIVICYLKDIKEKRKNSIEPIKKVYLDEAWESACAMEEFNHDKQKSIVSLIKQIDPNFEINLNLFSNKFLLIFEKYYSLTLHKKSWMKCSKKGHIFYSLEEPIKESDCPTCKDSKREYLF